jgi:hypothetical protein
MTNLIAFAGRKRSGKTTLAKLLQLEDNAVIITIANYLKYLCCDLMGLSYEELIEKKDNGYTFDIIPDNKWYKIIDKETNIGIDNIKKELEGKHITNIRQLLQVIGTDVIRKYDENWHVNKMIEEIESYPNDKLIVIDDVRFPNERKAILERSGRLFFIVRPNVSEVSNHASETALKWQDFDLNNIIINDNMPLEKFKAEFKVHYANDFDFFSQNSIFLNENKDLLVCGNFGFNTNKDDDFLQDILRQVKNDKLFKDYGIIRYHTYSQKYAKRYIEEVDKQIRYLEPHCNKFITCNPLITENLKIYF